MDRNFVSAYSGPDDSSSSSSLDPMFSGVSLQSILSLNPSVFSDYAAGTGLPSLAFLPDDSLSLNLHGEAAQGFNSDEDHMAGTREKKPTIVPKPEPGLFEYAATCGITSHPFDFFSGSSHCPTSLYDSSTFNILPQLHSIESFPHKRPRFDSLASTPNTMPAAPQHNPDPAAVGNNFFAIAPAHNTKPASSSLDAPFGEKSSAAIPQSNLARQRRQKLSDKTRCLQKLMPWDKKMDQATLLEEAYKYVKFLQAQFNALQSMPSDSPPFLSHCGASHSQSSVQNSAVFGDLERLNRNQVLQVLVNSPVAQTRLYSQGFCVFSVEQLTLLSNMTGKRLLLPQMMSDNASSKSFLK
ncbi:transcription factor bHLH117 [Neltuma alba]|uniref:transcription factor bHLH117 n=1 Tax=Neltuma alba TaxID=207710 RepID=UPI0010A51F9C|nr:transcription factor bHLH117 [Prosopis alba]